MQISSINNWVCIIWNTGTLNFGVTFWCDFVLNKEGCYMLEVFHNGKKLYLDATRRFNSYGRYVVIRFSFVSLPQVNILDTLTMAGELLRMSGLIHP